MVEAYLFPVVDANEEPFSWGRPQVDQIREFARIKFGWTNRKIDEILLPVVKRLDEKRTQAPIKNYFKVTAVECRQQLKVSDRMRKAIDRFSAGGEEPDPAVIEANEQEARGSKSRRTKKKKEEAGNGDTNEVEEKEKPKRMAKPRKPGKKSASVPTESVATDQPLTPTKRIRLPETNQPIPQREKDLKQMELNKEKAIQLMKNSKKK